MIDNLELSSSDKELLNDINAKIVSFIQSDDTYLQMDPMNSYYRMMVHKVGTEYKLRSESKGNGENRSVRLSKTISTKIPDNFNKQRIIERGIEITLQKKEELLVNLGSLKSLLQIQFELAVDLHYRGNSLRI